MFLLELRSSTILKEMTVNSLSPTVTIVMPAKNEAANLREVLPLLPPVHEVILVDGNSVDGTVEVARELMPGHPRRAADPQGQGQRSGLRLPGRDRRHHRHVRR